ncbi:hypothetical protein [Actinomadura sp. WMMB 499]|uniref:hypothetical protein n=1 Tax=Actinomadura sp. WMMB 499 TaxID=1219491 RepID=UPI001246AB53|nr:hypothetical protein [Actinomadura sp. WMMB 499]QFG23407.1 hypothetical protein F7P10_22105 [Actinomadura sp. WMMB 499]
MTARRLGFLVLGVTIFWTAAYVVVYLVRWEWQRALMSGVLLLIALVVGIAAAGARRLARIERRLAELREPPPVPRGRYATSREEEPPRFRWLEGDSYRVFIPVLLGAGIVVSGLAALVERVAGAFGRDAGPPAALAPPAGGVLAGAPEPDGRDGRARAIALGLAGALFAGVAVYQLAELTQDRPDDPVAAPASTLVIEADTRGDTGAAHVDPLVQRLWEYCRGSTRPYVEGGGAVPLGERRYAIVVRPALGEHALKRMLGCLQDGLIDRARFRVVSVQPG